MNRRDALREDAGATKRDPSTSLEMAAIDYIEAKGRQIITEGMLGGEDLVTNYTCKAGLFEAENHPLLEKKEED